MTYYLISSASSSPTYYLTQPTNTGDPYNLGTTDINSATQFTFQVPERINSEVSFSPFSSPSLFISNNYGETQDFFKNNYLVKNNIQSLWVLYPVSNGYITSNNSIDISRNGIPNGKYVINLVTSDQNSTTDWWKSDIGSSPSITNDSVNSVGDFPTKDKTINTTVIPEYIFSFEEFIPTTAVISSPHLIAISNPPIQTSFLRRIDLKQKENTCSGNNCCMFPSDNNYNAEFKYSPLMALLI